MRRILFMLSLCVSGLVPVHAAFKHSGTETDDAERSWRLEHHDSVGYADTVESFVHKFRSVEGEPSNVLKPTLQIAVVRCCKRVIIFGIETDCWRKFPKRCPPKPPAPDKWQRCSHQCPKCST